MTLNGVKPSCINKIKIYIYKTKKCLNKQNIKRIGILIQEKISLIRNLILYLVGVFGLLLIISTSIIWRVDFNKINTETVDGYTLFVVSARIMIIEGGMRSRCEQIGLPLHSSIVVH